jgi:hypothetical protein
MLYTFFRDESSHPSHLSACEKRCKHVITSYLFLCIACTMCTVCPNISPSSVCLPTHPHSELARRAWPLHIFIQIHAIPLELTTAVTKLNIGHLSPPPTVSKRGEPHIQEGRISGTHTTQSYLSLPTPLQTRESGFQVGRNPPEIRKYSGSKKNLELVVHCGRDTALFHFR